MNVLRSLEVTSTDELFEAFNNISHVTLNIKNLVFNSNEQEQYFKYFKTTYEIKILGIM